MRLGKIQYNAVARWCFVRSILLLVTCCNTQPVCSQSLAGGKIEGAVANRSPVVETIHERFANRRVKIERQVTLDEAGNYVNHGTWREWDPAGKLIAEGRYEFGRPVGLWTRRHARVDAPLLNEYPFEAFQAPFVSQATFVDGELNGDWVIFDANSQKCSQVAFDHGVRDGKMINFLPGEVVDRVITYRQGVINGEVLERTADGVLKSVATYVEGRQSITKLSYLPGSQTKTAEAHYLAAPTTQRWGDDYWRLQFAEYDTAGGQQRHGPYRVWFHDGQLQVEGHFHNDQEMGTFTWWHANGQKAVEGNFVDGRQQGQWTWWHPNGLKATVGQFDQGQQIGSWHEWRTDGQLAQRMLYDTPANPTAQLDLTTVR